MTWMSGAELLVGIGALALAVFLVGFFRFVPDSGQRRCSAHSDASDGDPPIHHVDRRDGVCAYFPRFRVYLAFLAEVDGETNGCAILKDRVWLALVFGTLAWMVLFAPFVDRTSLEQAALWFGAASASTLLSSRSAYRGYRGPGPVDLR